MLVLYRLSIFLYSTLLHVAAFFSPKAKQFIKGRKNLFLKLENFTTQTTKENLLFHCASLGEFEQGRPLIEEIKRRYSAYNIIVSFFSPSGYEVRKDYKQADFVTYLPLDTANNSKKFIELIQPKAVFIVKYEYWYFLLKTIHQQKTPTFLVSALFRPEQLHFKPYGKIALKTLSYFNQLFVQDQVSIDVLKNHQINHCTLAGDTRFDRVKEILHNGETPKFINDFCKGSTIFIAGSTWPEDEKILAPLLKADLHLKYIIAPHEIHESHLILLENQLDKPTIRYSQITSSSQLENVSILIIDTIGILSQIYRFGDFAYIGGAFGKGLHNTLEAAIFGAPLFFGPNYSKFNEAIQLVKLGGAQSISTGENLVKIINNLLDTPSEKERRSSICSDYVKKNVGATEEILSYCKKHDVL